MISIIFDAETTGLLLPSSAPLEKQPKIIEIGAVKVDEKGALLDQLSLLIHPGEAITAEITKITGIKDDDVKDSLRFPAVLDRVKAFFAGCDLLVAHNAAFDVGMLRVELERCGCKDFPWPAENVCTVAEYASEDGSWPKLTVLYERKLGKKLEQTHRALDDVMAMLEVLQHDRFFEKIA